MFEVYLSGAVSALCRTQWHSLLEHLNWNNAIINFSNICGSPATVNKNVCYNNG